MIRYPRRYGLFPTGLTQSTDTQTSTQTVVWLSGGTIGEKYVVTNRIVTAAGRTFDQSVKLKVKAR